MRAQAFGCMDGCLHTFCVGYEETEQSVPELILGHITESV